MPITKFEMTSNPEWLAIGHNSLSVEKFLRVFNDTELKISDFSTCGPNFRGADLCFVKDEETREKLMKFYLKNQYNKFLAPKLKDKHKTEADYIESELPVFKKQ